MCSSRPPCCSAASRGGSGLALVEVVVCLANLAVVLGGIITASVPLGYRAGWAGYNLSAQALARQPVEQAKSVDEAIPPT